MDDKNQDKEYEEYLERIRYVLDTHTRRNKEMDDKYGINLDDICTIIMFSFFPMVMIIISLLEYLFI